MADVRPAVSLIVLAWPPYQVRPRNVFSLLASLPSDPTAGMETVVVCNGDDESLARQLEQHPGVDVVVKPGVNLGVAAGWNAGAAAAHGDILVFANEDVLPAPGAIEALAAAFSDRTVGLAGVEGSLWDRRRMWQAAPWPSHSNERCPEPLFPVVSGHFFAVPRLVWIQVGGVHPELSPAFFEEVDLALRVRAAGYRLVLRPEACVDHPWGVSAASRRTRIQWEGKRASLAAIHRRNHRLLLREWNGGWRSGSLAHLPPYAWKVSRHYLVGGMSEISRRLRAPGNGNTERYPVRIVRGVISGLGAMVVARLVGLITVPLLVHILGLPLYGIWAIAGLIAGSQGLIDFGMASATVRFTAEAAARDDRHAALSLVGLSLAAYTLISLAGLAVLLALVPFLPGWLHLPAPQAGPARVLLIGAGVLFAVSNYAVVCSAVLQGLQQVHHANLALVVGQACYLVLLGMAWLLGWGVPGVLVATIALYLVQALVMAPMIVAGLPSGRVASPPLRLGRLLGFGSQVQLMAVADFLALQVPKLVAGFMLGASAAGRLDLALRIPAAAASVALPILPPVVPAAAHLSALGDRGALAELGGRASRYLASAAMPVFAVVLAFGPQLLRAWVGDQGAGLDLTLRLLAIALLAHVLPGPVAALAVGAGSPALVVRYKLLLVAVSVSLVVPFGWLWGLPGVALAMTAGFLVSLGYVGWSVADVVGGGGRSRLLRTTSHALAITLVATAGAATCYALLAKAGEPVAAVAAVIVGAALYLLLAWRTHLMDRRDVSTLVDAVRGRQARSASATT